MGKWVKQIGNPLARDYLAVRGRVCSLRGNMFSLNILIRCWFVNSRSYEKTHKQPHPSFFALVDVNHLDMLSYTDWNISYLKNPIYFQQHFWLFISKDICLFLNLQTEVIFFVTHCEKSLWSKRFFDDISAAIWITLQT